VLLPYCDGALEHDGKSKITAGSDRFVRNIVQFRGALAKAAAPFTLRAALLPDERGDHA
jgi:hypothetical protein